MRDTPVAALPRRARQAAVTLHVIASVGWLGVIAASLVLTVRRHLAAVVTLQTELIPALAVATLATGAVLSLGTGNITTRTKSDRSNCERRKEDKV